MIMKLKSALTALSFFMIAGFVFSGNINADCIPGEQRTTNIGAVFTCDASHRDLGEAWRDESGLIWGDIVKTTDGTGYYMAHVSEAVAYCASIDARLPSEEEFSQLRKYMGARTETYEGYSHHDDKILPNLKGYWFWMWSSFHGYLFSGTSGSISHHHRNDGYYVARCVVGR